jgi:hypothetical protein
MIYALLGIRELYVKPVICLISDKMALTLNHLNLNVGLVIRFNIIF